MEKMKCCSKCKIEKDESEFKAYTYKHKRTREVMHSVLGQCGSCIRLGHVKWTRKKGTKPRVYRGVHNCLDVLPCSKCHKNKPKGEFRIRGDKKMKHDYYNPDCKTCEKERANNYYASIKDNPVFKRKNIERVRAYGEKHISEIKIRKNTPEYKKKKAEWEMGRYKRKKDEINAKQREKRKNPKHKKMVRAYRCKNKDKIYKQEVITKKRYAHKHRDNLTDKYISRLLISQDIATKETLKQHPEIIEAKRLQIQIIRETKTSKNGN